MQRLYCTAWENIIEKFWVHDMCMGQWHAAQQMSENAWHVYDKKKYEKIIQIWKHMPFTTR